MFGSLSTDEQVFQLLNQVEASWYAQTGNLTFHYSLCQKLKEAWVRFKINEILSHCLSKVY